MSDITEAEAALLMLEMKLQIMEIGLRSLNSIIEECATALADVEKSVEAIYGSSN